MLNRTNFVEQLELALQGDYTANWFMLNCFENRTLNDNEIYFLLTTLEPKIAFKVSQAYVLRAWMHEYGIGGNKNLPAAIDLLEQAIVLDNTYAMNSRGLLHQFGQPANHRAAIKLYDIAIARNNTTAMYNRAAMYRNGNGTQVDYQAAFRLLASAVAQDNPQAMVALANMHFKGEGGPVNYPAAIMLCFKALRNLKVIDITRKNSQNLIYTIMKEHTFKAS